MTTLCSNVLKFFSVPTRYRLITRNIYNTTKCLQIDGDQFSNEYIKNLSEEYMYKDESLEQKRARLHWQSRKRGISETCLIFSTFSSKHLNGFNKEQVDAYDRLLNKPSNDWDIYYWMVGHKPVPREYDNNIMAMLQQHCSNKEKEERFQQPVLNYEPVATKY